MSLLTRAQQLVCPSLPISTEQTHFHSSTNKRCQNKKKKYIEVNPECICCVKQGVRSLSGECLMRFSPVWHTDDHPLWRERGRLKPLTHKSLTEAETRTGTQTRRDTNTPLSLPLGCEVSQRALTETGTERGIEKGAGLRCKIWMCTCCLCVWGCPCKKSTSWWNNDWLIHECTHAHGSPCHLFSSGSRCVKQHSGALW